jgi:hypothetical protein
MQSKARLPRRPGSRMRQINKLPPETASQQQAILPEDMSVSEPECVIRVKFLYERWQSEALSTTVRATDTNCHVLTTGTCIIY